VNFVPDATELAAIFGHAAAPAFLVGGLAAFISILLGRLNSILDRLRLLNAAQGGGLERGSLNGDGPILKRRALLLHRAIYLALLAGIATTLLLVIMIASAFIGLPHAYGGMLLFAVATVLFTLSLIKFAQEIKLALHEFEKF
jgi:hypothetical protein